MFISISKAAKLIGVSISTMRRWESENYLLPNFRTLGGHRRYCKRHLKESFLGKDYNDRINVGYARVSSHDQKDDLQRQANSLSSNFWTSTQGVGQYYIGSQNSGGALRRGGDWPDGALAGVFAADPSNVSSSPGANVGFRCVRL